MAAILLIDDDPDLSEFLRDELERRRHAVRCLDRGERGPDLLAAGGLDLVLLDNRMPGMSGLEFLGALKRRGLSVPVILMTGYADVDTAMEAMNLGAFDYVEKPGDFLSLARKLEPLIARALEIAAPAEEVRLPAEARPGSASGLALVGKSPLMLEVAKLIGCFAREGHAVLIRGETGTGKELVAQAIHTKSPRKGRSFVALNCGGLDETLLNAELFGHEKGAFTGAEKLRKGKFEYADGGTLFLDEIGDMPLPLQVKLLRVLESQEVNRLGSNDTIKVNVRLLSATHRDLEAAVEEGKFRRDLFYRLNGLTVPLPPLRERPEDIPLLAAYFLAREVEGTDRPAPALAPQTLEQLRTQAWPGNVRQLRNVIRRAVSVCRGPQILPAHLDLPAAAGGSAAAAPQQADGETALRRAVRFAWASGEKKLWPLLHDLLERELLALALAELGGNQSQVAERLGMARGTVIDRMKKYGLR